MVLCWNLWAWVADSHFREDFFLPLRPPKSRVVFIFYFKATRAGQLCELPLLAVLLPEDGGWTWTLAASAG